jgi:predicted RNase H-like HicB family nuclease
LYVAESIEVGTVSQGYTIEEAIANLKEATELYLEKLPVQEFLKSLMTTFKAAVNA